MTGFEELTAAYERMSKEYSFKNSSISMHEDDSIYCHRIITDFIEAMQNQKSMIEFIADYLALSD